MVVGAKQHLAEENLFEALLVVGKFLGMSRSVAMVFAALYHQENASTVEELAAETNLSKSAVSLALRDLIQLGAAHEIAMVGERCLRYEGQPDLANTVKAMIADRIQNPLAELRARLEGSAGSPTRLEQARNLLNVIENALATIQG